MTSAVVNMKESTKMLMRHPDEWLSYAPNLETVEIVCALVNLGIAKVNGLDQIRLKSRDKAARFIIR